MPTELDIEWIKINASIANDVYRDNTEAQMISKGWTRVLATSEVLPSGYFGASYADSFDNPTKIIIAHRGTSNIQDLIEDIEIINRLPFVQLFDALSFVKQTINKFRNQEISHTGHSLGAIVAEIMAIARPFRRNCVTFENPGSLEILKRWMSSITPYILSGADEYSIVIQSRVNIINTCNTQIGSTFILRDKPFGKDAGFIRPPLYLENPYYLLENTLDQHPIIPIISYLEAGGIISAVEDWPSGFEAGYKMFLSQVSN